MLGILITLLVIAGVAYCVLKNYPAACWFRDAYLRSPERNHAGGRRKVDALLWI